jgi:hypothetical protein
MAKLTEEPGEANIRRARAARVRLQRSIKGSEEWQEAKQDEARALEGLKRDFGVVDRPTIDWLIERTLRR